MKRSVLIGGVILALMAGSAYATDSGDTGQARGATVQSRTVKAADAAGEAKAGYDAIVVTSGFAPAFDVASRAKDGYDAYGRATTYVPGKKDYQVRKEPFSLEEMMYLVTH